RPAILDRNGMELAMDILVPSMFAAPRHIIDVDEAVEKLLAEIPERNESWLRAKLDGNEGFVWLKREMSPAAQDRIFDLGIPGIDFRTESKRYYPGGEVAAHILGSVNIDNQGIAGMERFLDREEVEVLQATGLARGRDLEPVTLAVDLRVQNAMHAELVDAMARYQAIAAAGVLLDVTTGEILALVSLPDFDPNVPASALEEGRLNRITAGTFELGSTFKTVTIAAAIDAGAVSITDEFDATQPIRFGRFSIDDFHGKERVLSLPEVYKYSSNIGTIRIMQALGKENYRAFLTRVGFDAPLSVELPETKRSNIPEEFSDIVAATASFGHGLTITPLHMASAMGAFANDGILVPPTLFRRSPEQARTLARSVISPRTSAYMRYLMRLNALEGSGKITDEIAAGYLVGGKTGTADKVVDGRYDSTKNLNVFASVFPMDNPRYSMLILVDEAKRENPQSGRTAAWNAGAVSGRIIQKVAPMLGILPNFSETVDQNLVPVELR
ncbi:MAG TPA: penicillin-binding protein 2, partial [Devosia sp.]|nr:penicillin-binding protein 2 [Devosia sp.]